MGKSCNSLHIDGGATELLWFCAFENHLLLALPSIQCVIAEKPATAASRQGQSSDSAKKGLFHIKNIAKYDALSFT